MLDHKWHVRCHKQAHQSHFGNKLTLSDPKPLVKDTHVTCGKSKVNLEPHIQFTQTLKHRLCTDSGYFPHLDNINKPMTEKQRDANVTTTTRNA